MNKFDKQNATALQVELKAAMQEVLAKHGVTATWRGGSFTDLQMMAKLELTITNAAGESQIEVDFKRYCGLFGWTPAHLGRTFTYGGRTFKMAGYRQGRSKWKFYAYDESGKRVLLPEDGHEQFQWL